MNRYIVKIKFILKKILPNFLVKIIHKRIIYKNKFLLEIYFLSFKLKYFIKKNYIKIKNIKFIDQDLILIGQVQRSGGSLLNQLFDNHFEIFSYPSELIVTKSKSNWSKKKFLFLTIKDDLLRNNIKRKNYRKTSQFKPGEYIGENKFIFNEYLQKKIYDSLKNKNLRNNFNAYFTSFFNSFKNYNGGYEKKKFIVAHLPKFIFFEENIKLFFELYPNGYIISVVRDPLTWLRSAKFVGKKSFNINENELLKVWKKNLDVTLELKKKFNNRVILIKFDDLILNTQITMQKLSKIINIIYDKSLILPSFNGNELVSNSSIQNSKGKINQDVLKNHKLDDIKKSLDKNYLNECQKLYHDSLNICL